MNTDEKCAYCKRTLEAKGSHSKLAATRDHVVPRSKSGRSTAIGARVLWACRQCNLIKGDMMPEAWSEFMAANPEWWRRPECQRGTLTKPLPWQETCRFLREATARALEKTAGVSAVTNGETQ